MLCNLHIFLAPVMFWCLFSHTESRQRHKPHNSVCYILTRHSFGLLDCQSHAQWQKNTMHTAHTSEWREGLGV